MKTYWLDKNMLRNTNPNLYFLDKSHDTHHLQPLPFSSHHISIILGEITRPNPT